MATTQPRELRELAKVFVGLELARRKPGQHENVPEHPVVSVGDLDDVGVPTLELLPRRAFRSAEGDELYQIRSGDLLVTARGTQFKVALVRDNSAGATATSTLFIVRPAQPWLSPLLLVLLQSPKVSAQLQSLARRSTSTLSWSAADVSSIVVPLPSQELAIRLAELIELSEEHYLVAIEAAQARRATARSVVLSTILPS
jgi:type I restriction enzyme M protein